jgi:hypothetical protein
MRDLIDNYCFVQDLYCVRSDLGNLLKALGRLDEAKVWIDVCDMHARRRLLLQSAVKSTQFEGTVQ